jgi:Phage Mu protein F like protein
MNQYKKLYARALKTYSPKFKKELQAQVDAFCRTQSLEDLPTKGLKQTIYSLHIAMGTQMADNSYKGLKKGLKSNLPNEHKGYFSDLWQSVIVRYLDYKGLGQLIKDITDTTKQQIQRYLKKGIEEGLTLKETIKNLKTAGITDYRAELIARTETAKAANTGSVVGAISTGLRTNKIWISTLDNRTRIIPRDKNDHYNMYGIQVPIDSKFEVPSLDNMGFEYMDYPGDFHASAGNVCNCRCTIGYQVVKDANNDYVTYDTNPPKGDMGMIWSMLNDKNNNDVYSLISQAL